MRAACAAVGTVRAWGMIMTASRCPATKPNGSSLWQQYAQGAPLPGPARLNSSCASSEQASVACPLFFARVCSYVFEWQLNVSESEQERKQAQS